MIKFISLCWKNFQDLFTVILKLAQYDYETEGEEGRTNSFSVCVLNGLGLKKAP